MDERKNVYSDVGHDVSFLRRRLSLLGKVFPIPLRLEKDEHLRDGIFRAVHENGHKDTAVASKLAESKTFRKLSAFKSIADPAEIERLLDVLGLSDSAAHVIGATAKPASISRSHISFFGHDIPRNHLTSLRRVSPLALRSRNYQRALWSVAPFSFDIETKEVLLSRCPHCGDDLDWLKTNGVENCGHCNFDLRASPQPTVSIADDEAMAYVTGTINPLLADGGFRLFRSSLSDVANRGEQFQLAVRLAVLYQRSQGLDESLVRIAPYSLERAGRALLRWPKGVAELAEEISSLSETTFQDTLIFRLQYDQNFSQAIRREVKAAFDQSKREHAKNRPLQPSLCTGEPRPGAGTVASVNKRTGFQTSLEIAVEAVRNIKSIRNVSRVLGLPVPDVLELFLAGYLTELRADLLTLGIDHKCQPKIDFFNAITGEVRHVKQYLSIASARFAVDIDLQVRWSAIFAAMASGELHVHGDTSEHGFVHNLRTTSYDQMVALARTSPGSRFRNATLTQPEVGMVLGCCASLGAALMRSGIIPGRPTVQKLADFRRDHAFTFELRDLTRMNGSPVYHPSRPLIKAGVRCKNLGVTKVWRRNDAYECLGIP